MAKRPNYMVTVLHLPAPEIEKANGFFFSFAKVNLVKIYLCNLL